MIAENDLGDVEVGGTSDESSPFSFDLDDYLSAVDHLDDPSEVIEGEAGSSKYDQYSPSYHGHNDHYYEDPHHKGGACCGGCDSHGYDDYYNDCDSCMNACSLADIKIVKDNNAGRDTL